MTKGAIYKFCRRRIPAYWMSYLLPEERSRLWVLFCYCFRMMDDLLDGGKLKLDRVDAITSSAISGKPIAARSTFEEGLYNLISECRKDKRLLSAGLEAYEGEKRDVLRGKVSNRRQLASAIRGKSVAFTKIWINMIAPRLDERTVDYLAFRLGTCGQILDDVKDIKEDFSAGRVNIPRERLPRGRLTLKKVLESEYWREECARAERLHSDALDKIGRSEFSFRSRVLFLALALYLDPKHCLAGEPTRAKRPGGNNNILRKVSFSLAKFYPKNHAVGSAIASVVGLPILVLLLISKGYSKFLFQG